jgi:hypothetical protein
MLGVIGTSIRGVPPGTYRAHVLVGMSVLSSDVTVTPAGGHAWLTPAERP